MLDNPPSKKLSNWLRANTRLRLGRDYIYDRFVANKTSLIVVDMQNYFMKPGFLAACPMAIEIVPAVNKLAQKVREEGGVVIWIQTTSEPEATKDWGVYQELYSPENWQRRNVELAPSHEGYQLWPDLSALEGDIYVKKSRFSAFIQGASDLDARLKSQGIETLLITGVATNVCCEATARDGMMLNYRTVMVSDALAAMSMAAHESSLKALHCMFTEVQTVDEVSQRLSL